MSIDNLTAEIKYSKNGKLVAEVKVDDCRYYGPAYKGETVTINGIDVQVCDVGAKFGERRDVRMYLYIVGDLKPASVNKPCSKCGTYCYGDCVASA